MPDDAVQGDRMTASSSRPARRRPRLTLAHGMALIVLTATASAFYVDLARQDLSSIDIFYSPYSSMFAEGTPFQPEAAVATLLVLGVAVGAWRRATIAVLLLGTAFAFAAHVLYAALQVATLRMLWLPIFLGLGFAGPLLVLRRSVPDPAGGPRRPAVAVAEIGLNGGLTVIAYWVASLLSSHMVASHPPPLPSAPNINYLAPPVPTLPPLDDDMPAPEPPAGPK